MASSTNKLLFACVALAHLHCVWGDYCRTDSFGDENGWPQPLPDVPLSPRDADWNIQIPDVSYCMKVGVKLTCCDEEAPPEVYVSDTSTAWVRRTGPRLVPATVKSTLLCSTAPRHPYHPNQPQYKAAPRPRAPSSPWPLV